MAYIDFAPDAVTLAPAPRHDPLPDAAPPAAFSALEWSVVAIARNDKISSLRAPSPLSIALGSVFGPSRNPRLADGKLEALRRLAVLGWHRGFDVPTRAIEAFLTAGWSGDHYELLLASIGKARMTRRARG